MKYGNNNFSLPESSLAKLDSLTFLPPHWRQTVLSHGQIVPIAKNAYLFSQGDPAESFFIILSGAIKLHKNLTDPSDRNEQTLVDLLGPTELVGIPSMFSHTIARHSVSARSMGPSEVLQIRKSFFHEHWLRDPVLNELTLQHLNNYIQRLQNDRAIQRYSLEKKLAYFITEKVHSIPHLRITRQDMADGVGANQESVIRTLSAWESSGLISSDNQEIKVHHLQKLRSLWAKLDSSPGRDDKIAESVLSGELN